MISLTSDLGKTSRLVTLEKTIQEDKGGVQNHLQKSVTCRRNSHAKVLQKILYSKVQRQEVTTVPRRINK
jgi:hypothetical protein